MNTNPVAISSGSGSGATSNTATTGGIDSMFLQLLLTQLKNQDPLSPMDPSTFVQQLAQVTTLDQLTQINQLLQNTLGKSTSTTGNSNSGGH